MFKKTWFFKKNIIITGASSGIGFELAKLLVCEYECNVLGIARNLDKLVKAKEIIDVSNIKKGSFVFKQMDVSDLKNWIELKNETDKNNFDVDVIINNAGIMLPFNKFENQTVEDILKVININFYPIVYSYKVFVEHLKRKKGAIINISSSSALCPVVGAGVYGSSKSAIKSLTEVLAVENKDLYVSCVMPGFTTTDLFREQGEIKGLVKKVATPKEKMAKKILYKLKKKRKKIIVGLDAHLMHWLYKFSPSFATRIIAWVLKSSKDELFINVFND